MQALAIKRNRLQVLTEILQVCRLPQTKSRIMHKANLSHGVLQDCLFQLQELSFIELFSDSPDLTQYMTTERGRVFLGKWSQLQELLTPKEQILIKQQKKLTSKGPLFSFK
ncbi:MAG: winged helix-turn-helix domain-containing protein [Candidatus Bathyarchaeota archaeon]|nr:winged helix-turn-helix domain-containing protein [Candidatus Bathyarchaeota archaeon]